MPNTEQVILSNSQSHHRSCFIKKAVFKDFAIFIGNHLFWSLFFNFIKERLQRRYFVVGKYLRTPIEEDLRTAARDLTLESDPFVRCNWTILSFGHLVIKIKRGSKIC